MGEYGAGEEVFRGDALSVRVRDVPEPIGGATRFEIVERPPVVAVVAVRSDAAGGETAEPRVALVRQPRPAIDRDTWEIPAGSIGPDEVAQPEAAALRELREETGCVASGCVLLAHEYPSPGYSTERISIYLATDIAPGGSGSQDRTEIAEVRWLPLADALTMCRDGQIEDGKTVLGLYLTNALLEGKLSLPGGDTMPRDVTNMPFERTRPGSDDVAVAIDGTRTSGAQTFDATLKLDGLLLEEFSYAGTVAYQAMEDRARIFNLYLLLVGVLASGLGAVYQLSDKVGAYTAPLAVALLAITGLMGTSFFVKLIRIRQAYRENLIAMNVIKEYYIKHFSPQLPDVGTAFRWRLQTIPAGERFTSTTTVITSTVALLGSLCFAGAGIVGWEHWVGASATNLPFAADVQPYVAAAIILVVAMGLHLLSFRHMLHRRKEQLALRDLALQLDIPLTKAMAALPVRKAKSPR